jgi:hypothetical protein
VVVATKDNLVLALKRSLEGFLSGYKVAGFHHLLDSCEMYPGRIFAMIQNARSRRVNPRKWSEIV